MIRTLIVLLFIAKPLVAQDTDPLEFARDAIDKIIASDHDVAIYTENMDGVARHIVSGETEVGAKWVKFDQSTPRLIGYVYDPSQLTVLVDNNGRPRQGLDTLTIEALRSHCAPLGPTRVLSPDRFIVSEKPKVREEADTFRMIYEQRSGSDIANRYEMAILLDKGSRLPKVIKCFMVIDDGKDSYDVLLSAREVKWQKHGEHWLPVELKGVWTGIDASPGFDPFQSESAESRRKQLIQKHKAGEVQTHAYRQTYRWIKFDEPIPNALLDRDSLSIAQIRKLTDPLRSRPAAAQ